MNHQVTNMAYCLSLSSLIHEKRENLNNSLQKKISPKKTSKTFFTKTSTRNQFNFTNRLFNSNIYKKTKK